MIGMANVIASLLLLQYILYATEGSDITSSVFGTRTDVLPAAFGDFNSDELTDVFVLDRDGKTLEILLAAEEEPLLRPSKSDRLKHRFDVHITSVVPGDFDGDALMDVLVTTASVGTDKSDKLLTDVHICWGGSTYMNCSTNKEQPIIRMRGQPLALDYNEDMIIDLFGVNKDGKGAFWVFGSDREAPKEVVIKNNTSSLKDLSVPHAHSFLDLNHDSRPDLFITFDSQFEVWYGMGRDNKEKFVYGNTIPLPPTKKNHGQSTFIDVELKGEMKLVTPVCHTTDCTICDLMVYTNTRWETLGVNFKDNNNNDWCFAKSEDGKYSKYTNVITLHTGDFNMDGYPDILATLRRKNDKSMVRSFLLENVPCEGSKCDHFSRNYQIKWDDLYPFSANNTEVAVFFDFYQDGTLDVILVRSNEIANNTVAAFKNTLDYDANFIKVMVLTGLKNSNNGMIDGRVGKKKRTYGTNLPGPSIGYIMTTQDGNKRLGIAAQLQQSAHFSLNLPYTIFGLGRTPNFVDVVTVGLSNHSKEFSQIIPNSQMVVIPWPTDDPSRWKAQLFVTPSKVILTSVAALTGVCGLITVIIGILHWKERQEDKKERLQESHRFHFDAM